MDTRSIAPGRASEAAQRVAQRLRPSPPRSYDLDDYKRWFPRNGKTFLRYLKRHEPLRSAPEPSGPALGVLITPWVSTPVPWYASMLAIGLARRGRRVVLVWDDTPFPELHLAEQNRAIGQVIDHLGQWFPVVRVSQQPAAPAADGDWALIESLTAQNVTWTMRGARQSPAHDVLAADVRAALADSLPFIRSALDEAAVTSLVLPGGVYGKSGLFRCEASSRGARVVTFDTDRRIPQVCVSGVAAQNDDIPRAFAALWGTDDATRRHAVDTARAEFQRRIESRDAYGFQAVPARGPAGAEDHAGAVLIPLNVEWDTAALGKHVTFRDTPEWLTSTVRFVLDHHDGPVIVRQHPSERRKGQESQLDAEGLLRGQFGDDPRYRFIAAEDPVSSYDLLHAASLVLPFVSTIAIEAAALGKPVVISGAAYYADLGFVWSAASQDDYFDLVRRGLAGDLGPRPQQEDRAWLCYYLTAVENRFSTDFTPHPDQFWQWSRRAPQALFEEPEVEDILEAIDQDIPISLLRHRRHRPADDATPPSSIGGTEGR